MSKGLQLLTMVVNEVANGGEQNVTPEVWQEILAELRLSAEKEKKLGAAHGAWEESQKRIEELEEREYLIVHGQSGGKTAAVQLFEARAKLKSAEAVMEVGRHTCQQFFIDQKKKEVAGLTWTCVRRDALLGLEAALSAHDKEKQEPEEKHFIEEGLMDA